MMDMQAKTSVGHGQQMRDNTRAHMLRELARNFFHQALNEASIERSFARAVSCEGGILLICDERYDLGSYGRVLVTSIGKAAHTLVQALENRTGRCFEGIVSGSVVAKLQNRKLHYFQGGHPTPNAESIASARAMLKSVESIDDDALVIFMISGGGSSIVEAPFDDTITLEDLIITYRVLVHSGATISEVNAIRKHLSAIKGGRLAQAAAPAQQVSLLISDVPNDSPDALASGPTMPDSTSVNDCYSLVSQYGMLEQFPTSVRNIFERRDLTETPKFDDPAFHGSRWWTLLSNESAIQSAADTAKQARYAVEVDNSCDDWDYAKAADYLLARIRRLREKWPRTCLISGGEVTVKTSNGGVGGRNQQFALYCAEQMANENITVLSAGTDGIDGIDGNSPAAGAIADGTTIARAQELGMELRSHLLGFDAFPVFDQLGDAIITGPTGNNLRDLRIILADS